MDDRRSVEDPSEDPVAERRSEPPARPPGEQQADWGTSSQSNEPAARPPGEQRHDATGPGERWGDAGAADESTDGSAEEAVPLQSDAMRRHPAATPLTADEGVAGRVDEVRPHPEQSTPGVAERVTTAASQGGKAVGPRIRVAKALSVARLGLGVAYLVFPRLAGPTWIGRAAGKSGARVVVAGLGARDVGLGAGALAALARGDTSRHWLQAQFVSDLTDFTSTLLRGRDVAPGPRLSGLLITGGATAMAGFAAFAPED